MSQPWSQAPPFPPAPSAPRRRGRLWFVVALAVAALLAAVLWSGRGSSSGESFTGDGRPFPTTPAPGKSPSPSETPAPTDSSPPAPDGSETASGDVIGADLLADLRPAPTPCTLPRFTLAAADQERFVRTALDCLEDMWRPALAKAGVEYEPVSLKVVTRAAKDCFGDPVAPTDITFYCGEDTTVYWPAKDTSNEGAGPAEWPWFLFIAMHEYGHHLQLVTGVWEDSYAEWALTEEGSPEELLLTRRQELQAQCLAGVSLNAARDAGVVSRSDARTLLAFQDSPGVDEDTHGGGPSNEHWTESGYRAGTTTDCDTWSAPPAEVD